VFWRRTDSPCNLASAAGNFTIVRRSFRVSHIVFGVCVSLLGVTLVVAIITFLGIPPGLRPHVYWLFSSRQYKQATVGTPTIPNQLAHAEWQGDGWGGTAVGDWMGYIVFDPSDSLPQAGTKQPPRKIKGIPCDVVSVRRLERGWYSVVTDMNQFWDSSHPNC